jgi:hypothetical protein
MEHLDIDPNGVEEGEADYLPACITGCEPQDPDDEEPEQVARISTFTRTMKVAYKRVAGRWVGMYETRVYRPDGSIFRNELVDLDEVCLL